MKINVIGTAITKFGELWQDSLEDLIQTVVHQAIADAGLDAKDIDAVFVANKAAGNFENQHHLNALVSQMLGHYPPAMRIEAACASGSLAVLATEHALMAGVYQTVLVVGVEKMTDVSAEETTQILSGAASNSAEYASTFPALYALLTQINMMTFHTTREQLSSVAVKNHLHAMNNPHAQFHKKFTIEQVSQSQIVADPLRILDCSPISDGAAAVILSTKKHHTKVKVLGFGHAQDSLDLASRTNLTELMATKHAAKAAYHQAGIKPADIDAAEVHDCFTIAEILAIEDLGFFDKGSGGAQTLDQQTTYGGKLVINPSGGLKACGHPVGATGVKQIAYLANAIANNEFKHGLAHNVGGSGATAVVHILGK